MAIDIILILLIIILNKRIIMSIAKQVDEEVQSWKGWKLDGLGGGRWFSW